MSNVPSIFLFQDHISHAHDLVQVNGGYVGLGVAKLVAHRLRRQNTLDRVPHLPNQHKKNIKS
jgi:hypothetical protein